MFQRIALLARRRIQEGVRYSRWLRSLSSMVFTARALLSRSPAVRLCLLGRAYGYAEHAVLWEPIACAIRTTCQKHGAAQLDWRASPNAGPYRRLLERRSELSRTTMAKAPGPNGEKGVLMSTFEYNWLHLVQNPEVFRALCADFNIILSTSWSATDYPLLAQILILAPDTTFFVQSCSLAERPKIETFHPRLRTLDTMPCDWLSPALFPQPAPGQRDIDLLVVSNWAPFKRHWALFNALRDLPASLRVVCIGQPDTGYTMEDIRKLKQRLGAPQDIEFLECLPIEQVSALQCRARLAVIVSLWEGCCVAAAEGLMAGAPLAMCRDAHVGPLAYIDETTGFILSRVPKAREIAHALSHAAERQPRAFAESRLSYLTSTRSLNDRLRAHEAAADRPWTQDLAPLCWRPHPKIAHDEDRQRLAPDFAALHCRFPDLFPADLLEISHL